MQQPANHHLAELNIGRIRYDLDDPRMADFTNNLELVNGLAERSPGFVWRYTDDSGNAANTRPYADPLIIVNCSVWESVAALEHFVWQTVHKRFYGRRADWFEHFDGPAVALWWVPIGHRPTMDEAIADRAFESAWPRRLRFRLADGVRAALEDRPLHAPEPGSVSSDAAVWTDCRQLPLGSSTSRVIDTFRNGASFRGRRQRPFVRCR